MLCHCCGATDVECALTRLKGTEASEAELGPEVA